jgi:hypothetical protein
MNHHAGLTRGVVTAASAAVVQQVLVGFSSYEFRRRHYEPNAHSTALHRLRSRPCLSAAIRGRCHAVGHPPGTRPGAPGISPGAYGGR